MKRWKNLLVDILVSILIVIFSIFGIFAELFPTSVPDWVWKYVAPIGFWLFIAGCVAIIIFAIIRKKRK